VSSSGEGRTEIVLRIHNDVTLHVDDELKEILKEMAAALTKIAASELFSPPKPEVTGIGATFESTDPK
jgi:hypothetical protein